MKKIALSVVMITTLIFTNTLIAQGGFLVASSIMDELLADPEIVADAQATAAEKCVKQKPNQAKYSKELAKYKAVPKKLAVYKKKLATYLKTQQKVYDKCIKLKKTAYFKALEKELNAMDDESDSSSTSTPSVSTPSISSPGNQINGGQNPTTPTATNSSQGELLRQLVTGSRWCTSSYSESNTTYGNLASSSRYSNSTITFDLNGTYSMITNSESTSVGYGADIFNSGSTPFQGQWKIENDKLLLADEQTFGQFYDPLIVQTQFGFQSLLTKKEYTRC